MTYTVWIKHLSYDRDRELVSADLAGEMGGRHVDVQLQFALRAHGKRTDTELRSVILLEIQQILRSAANVTLAELPTLPVHQCPSRGRNAALLSRWEIEVG